MGSALGSLSQGAEDSTLRSRHFPKAPLLLPSLWGSGCQHVGWLVEVDTATQARAATSSPPGKPSSSLGGRAHCPRKATWLQWHIFPDPEVWRARECASQCPWSTPLAKPYGHTRSPAKVTLKITRHTP